MINVTSNMTSSLTCVTENWMFIFAEMIVASFALPINVFLTISLFVFRNKLRNRMVNIYAANVVVAVCVNAIIRLSDTTWSLFGLCWQPKVFPDHMKASHQILLSLWLFHKSLVVTMYVVITGGIAFVIMALRGNLFRVHRTVAGVSNNMESQDTKMKANRLSAWCSEHRKAQAIILITISWAIPLVSSIIAITTDRTCLKSCRCIYNYIPSDRNIPACGYTCSLIWPPLPNTALLIGCFVWYVFVILLIALLIKSNVDFNRVSKQIMTTNVPPVPKEPQMEEFEEEGSVNVEDYDRTESQKNHWKTQDEPTEDQIETREYAQEQEEEDVETQVEPSEVEEKTTDIIRNKSWRVKRWMMFRHSTKHSSLLLRKLSKQLNQLLVISIVYIIGTGILVTIVTYSILAKDELIFVRNEQLMVIVLMLPAVAECFSAVALCMELPNLRSAVHSMMEVVLYILSFGCLRK